MVGVTEVYMFQTIKKSHYESEKNVQHKAKWDQLKVLLEMHQRSFSRYSRFSGTQIEPLGIYESHAPPPISDVDALRSNARTVLKLDSVTQAITNTFPLRCDY